MKEQILYHGIPIVGRMPLFTFDNRQGQTRRLNELEEINEDPGAWQFIGLDEHKAIFAIPGFVVREIKLPWHIGDVRCMCEPLACDPFNGMAYYHDDGEPLVSLITGKPLKWRWKRDYLSAMHMPTEAARTVCRITDIRVEKLQEISERDALAEGCANTAKIEYGSTGKPIDYMGLYAVDRFQILWDAINAKRGYGWDVPQRVWVNVFEKLVDFQE